AERRRDCRRMRGAHLVEQGRGTRDPWPSRTPQARAGTLHAGCKVMMPTRAYLAIGVLIAFLALGGTALWYRTEAISAEAAARQARADLTAAEAANRAQQETIGRLRASAEANDRIIAQMTDH